VSITFFVVEIERHQLVQPRDVSLNLASLVQFNGLFEQGLDVFGFSGYTFSLITLFVRHVFDVDKVHP